MTGLSISIDKINHFVDSDTRDVEFLECFYETKHVIRIGKKVFTEELEDALNVVRNATVLVVRFFARAFRIANFQEILIINQEVLRLRS